MTKKEEEFFNKLQDIFFDNNFQFKYKDFNYTNPMIDIWCFDNIIKINICNIELNIIRIEKRILLDTLCLVFILSNGKYIDLQIDKNGRCLLLSNFEDVLENCN